MIKIVIPHKAYYMFASKTLHELYHLDKLRLVELLLTCPLLQLEKPKDGRPITRLNFCPVFES